LRYLGVSAGLATGNAQPSPSHPVDDAPAAVRGDAAGASSSPGVVLLGQGEVRVPDALGLGARDAMRAVTSAGLLPEMEGSGRLVRQTPAPGTATPKGALIHLVFEPPS
jgi:cell division protein FtsI (penicillin-binding protein 3)